MKGLRTKPGHVLSVETRNLGSAIDGDQSAGATSITIQDCADFDDQVGGSLTLNDVTYTYGPDDVDDDASTIAISPALAADASDGDEVTILDNIRGEPQWAAYAEVTIDGEDPGDTLTADIESAVVEQLPEGVRGLNGEGVILQWDANDQLSIIGLVGLDEHQAGFVRWTQDYATATGNVDTTIHLTYQPVPDTAVKVSWGGVGLHRDEWDFTDPWTIVVTARGFHAGDVFEAHYAYTDPTPRPVVPGSAIFVDSTEVDNNSTSVALPTGTTAGDLLVLTIGTGGLAGGVPSTSDPRIIASYTQGHQMVAYGYADASTAAVTFTAGDSEHNGQAVLAAYRVTGTPVVAHSVGASNLTPTLPTGTFQAGVAATSAETGATISSPHGGWVNDGHGGGSSQDQDSWSDDTGCGTFSTVTSGAWAAIVIGFEED